MKLEDIKKLHQKRYREEFGYFLVEGEHLVLELQKAALRNPQLQGCELYVTRGREQWRSQFATHVISEAQMARIADTKTPQGIVALVPLLRSAPQADERPVYLHEIQDPGNLGQFCARWRGSRTALPAQPCRVDPHNAKVVRASMGAIFMCPSN
jgi:TrmH family RNA methyltransferase